LGVYLVGEEDKLLVTLSKFLTLILKGEVPASIRPILYGAALTALKKKCGGIRPIAVGNVWLRLLSKIVCKRITPDLAEELSPYQLGVGVKSGAEAGAHAGRVYYGYSHSTVKAFLKVDFRNAFNELRRDALLSRVLSLHSSSIPIKFQALFW